MSLFLGCTSSPKKETNFYDLEVEKFSSSVKLLLTDLEFLKKEILKINANKPSVQRILIEADDKWMKEDLKKATNITKLNKIKSDFIHGFEVDLFELKANLPDGTTEESTRWITKHGITLKEVGFIKGNEGKLHFYSEFSNVKVFKQDDKLYEVPETYKIAPIEDLDDVNELLKTMVKRG